MDTITYTYGDTDWGDLLTAYDGQAITYDDIGNPESIGPWTYTWEHGRQLVSMAKSGTTWTYTYNADGLRTSRSNGTTTYSYVYNGSSLSQMTVGSNTLYFAYDASGSPMSVTYNGTTYYYALNLQGDVMAILNASGTAVVTYTYDAWGNILSSDGTMASTLGTHNPLRYRGYVYDNETELYYLQSRFYDPQMGRFLNADALVSTGQGILGNNMFAYCLNNPPIHVDSIGMWTITIGIGGNGTAGIGVSIGIGISIDSEGNIALQWNYSIPTSEETTTVGLLDIGIAFQFQVTDKETVYDLEGVSTYIGGSGGMLGYGGFDVVVDAPASSSEGEATGVQVSFGLGAGLDVHVAQTYTNTIASKNIFRALAC